MPLPELIELEHLIERVRAAHPQNARARAMMHVAVGSETLPIWSLTLGNPDPAAPSLAYVGGVHGLERIGTQVVLAYMRTLEARLAWDRVLHEILSRVRLVFVPLLNPGGMLLSRRANPRGVDLMRNAPRSPHGHGTFFVGGQRLSNKLPWYAGQPELELERESRALIQVIKQELLTSEVSLAIDCHSGFGMRDRLWFPYARTRRPFPRLAEVVGIQRLLDRSLPHHVYRMEPQANAYTIQGDLWDHLYDLQRAEAPERVFVPLTLEMGSWAWVRKNPRQMWSRAGSFNPVLPHRLARTLRRHLALFDLLLHAMASSEAWAFPTAVERAQREHAAFLAWPRG